MKWQVWLEGYIISGNRDKAQLLGEYEAETWRDACHMWAGTAMQPDLFDSERLTYWGQRLFDNEADARKAFG